MECKNCGSKNLVLFKKPNGNHNVLFCEDCFSFQKLLTDTEVMIYMCDGGKRI